MTLRYRWFRYVQLAGVLAFCLAFPACSILRELALAPSAEAPEIQSVTASPATTLAVGSTVTVTVIATDSDSTDLTYTYSIAAGSATVLTTAHNQCQLQAPATAGSFQLRVLVSDGELSDSARVTFTVTNASSPTASPTADPYPPGPVTHAGVSTTNHQVTLTWTPPSDADFDRVVVQKTVTAAAQSADDGTRLYAGTDRSVVDPDPGADTVTFYTLFALDVWGNVSPGVALQVWMDAPPTLNLAVNGARVSGTRVDVAPGLNYTLSIAADFGHQTIALVMINTHNVTAQNTAPVATQFAGQFSRTPPPRDTGDTLAIVLTGTGGTRVSANVSVWCKTATLPSLDNLTRAVILPEAYAEHGGMIQTPSANGDVYYFNDQHLAVESDIRLSTPNQLEVWANRYLRVAGTAIPDDAGFTDRDYNSVRFSIARLDEADSPVSSSVFALPVAADHQFDGYLYFRETGTFGIYAFRSANYALYPHDLIRVASTVAENQSTLFLKVQVAEAVPAVAHHLLPTTQINNDNEYIRRYARYLTQFCTSDLETVQTLFHFLVFGDERGAFLYRYYDEIDANYLPREGYTDIFIASHFLIMRQGVCNEFTELFAALTRSLGFKVTTVSGDSLQNEGHAWNRIYLDGRWQRLDATWANNNPDQYTIFAEFYDDFDADYFDTEHGQYYRNFREEW